MLAINTFGVEDDFRIMSAAGVGGSGFGSCPSSDEFSFVADPGFLEKSLRFRRKVLC